MKINVILAVLSLVLAWPCWSILNAEHTEEFVEVNSIPRMFEGFNPHAVDMVSLTQHKPSDGTEPQPGQPAQPQFDQLTFKRNGDGWVMIGDDDTFQYQGLTADGRMIEEHILDHMEEIRLDPETTVPSEKLTDEFRAKHKITPETGILIRCFTAERKELASLVRGERSDITGNKLKAYYVCRPDRTKEVSIYECRKNWHLPLRASDWALKNIHFFEPREVDIFHIRNEYGEAMFKQDKITASVWHPVAEFCSKNVGDVLSGDVSVLVVDFREVNAESFHREKIAADMPAKGGTYVSVTLKTGERFEIWIAGDVPGESQLFAVSSEHRFRFGWNRMWASKFVMYDPKKLFARK